MALVININDLLNKQKIESNRIEFKKGWNPGSIYHSICAFANDFDDLGGGYIIVGVDTDDKTGMAVRPVEGVPMEKIDNILQEMVGYNNKMAPYYLPRTSVEEVDGKQLIVIWCPAGSYRPYSVPVNVTAKGTKEYFYIRVVQVVLKQEAKLSLNCENWLIVCLLTNEVIVTFSWKIFLWYFFVIIL